MNPPAATFPRWSTASYADAPETSPAELSELGAHVSRCNGCRGRWFELRCVAESVHGFVAPRFVTTLALVGAVVGAAVMML